MINKKMIVFCIFEIKITTALVKSNVPVLLSLLVIISSNYVRFTSHKKSHVWVFLIWLKTVKIVLTASDLQKIVEYNRDFIASRHNFYKV